MIIVPLSNSPNQEFSILLDGFDFRIVLRTIGQLTYMSLWKNDEVVFLNQICTPNNYINSYRHTNTDFGDFIFMCENENYPYYEFFNESQNLAYVPAGEVRDASA